MSIITKRGGETIVSETDTISLSPLASALMRAISFRATAYLDEVGLMLRPQELEAIFRFIGHEYVSEKEASGEL